MSCMYSSSSRGVVSLATPPLLIKLRQKEKEVNLEQKKEIYLEGWAGGLASLDMVDIGSNPPMSCWSSYNHKLFFVTAKTPLRPVAMVKRAKGNHPPPRFASSMPGTLKASLPDSFPPLGGNKPPSTSQKDAAEIINSAKLCLSSKSIRARGLLPCKSLYRSVAPRRRQLPGGAASIRSVVVKIRNTVLSKKIRNRRLKHVHRIEMAGDVWRCQNGVTRETRTADGRSCGGAP